MNNSNPHARSIPENWQAFQFETNLSPPPPLFCLKSTVIAILQVIIFKHGLQTWHDGVFKLFGLTNQSCIEYTHAPPIETHQGYPLIIPTKILKSEPFL